MVAKIKSGKSLIGALYYNENKVKVGKATLIAASGYMKNHVALSFHDKLFRLTDLAERNLRTKTNTVHLSLNFDVTENISNGLLEIIADQYMEKIGFGHQPYLIYKHFDAGHPHIHILTTNIEADGKRISLHNMGELLSEPARKAIEIDFGLVKAGNKKNKHELDEDIKIRPLEYGRIGTKKGITNIVNTVTKTYKFTSLPELNAILNLYHVMADRGTKESVMFKNGGLHYWATDESGKKIGVPIKASSIYQKPTLRLLEDRFRLNEYLRKPYKEKLKTRIDRAIAHAGSLDRFKSALQRAGIALVIRENSDGRVYGLSYIDQLNKVVFNGSDLGKTYSAAAMMNVLQFKTAEKGTEAIEWIFEKASGKSPGDPLISNNSIGRTLLDELLIPDGSDQSPPDQFEPKKKRKKRRKLNR